MVYEGYVHLGYKPKDDLVCTFRIEPATDQAREAVAAESSVGTWKEVATMTPRIRRMGAKVFSVKGNYFKVAYPKELFEPGNMPQIFSSIAGNVFGMKEVENLRLIDVRWPKKIMDSFRGPQYGVPGVRKLLRVPKRPLVGTIIKPKLGLDPKEHAKVAYEAWVGGIDMVKDDENLSSQTFNNFYARAIETIRMKERAERETGERKVYICNVTAETREMLKRAKFLRDHGNDYAMVDILTVGWSGLQTLREEMQKLKLVLHGHRAMHAALTRNPKHGVSMRVLAEAARLVGVDQLHVGTAVGKMEGGKADLISIVEDMESQFVKSGKHMMAEKWGRVKPVFAVCSGGLHPGLVRPLVNMLGKDIIIQAGGGVHGYPGGTRAGAAAMRKAVENV
ncbi:MAG: type III ribulose-bisphosphate carboxylase [Candidatus Aenigmatarchaeota archaeon]